MRVLAITDHDSTEGIVEARLAAAAHPSLTIVPGIELNCDVEGAELHILGYFVDVGAEWFQVFLRGQRAERATRIHQILARLEELGIFLDAAEVFALVKDGAAGRPHVAQAMVDRGYVRSVREAFDRYLRNGGPATVPRRRLTPGEAVAVIRRANGLPVLAHPGLAKRDASIPGLIAGGLGGIEAYYPEHSAAQTAAYVEMCRRFDLVATGGSDYHGPRSGHSARPGLQNVPEEAWITLQRVVRGGAGSSAPLGVVASYTDVAHEYYDARRHPTCANFLEASGHVLDGWMAARAPIEGSLCEVGAGRSVVAPRFRAVAAPGARLLLVDSSEAMLHHSHDVTDAQRLVGDARRLPLRAETVSALVASLGDPYNDPGFWREVSRVLHPGGQGLFTTPSYQWASVFRGTTDPAALASTEFELTDGSRVVVPSMIYPVTLQRALIEDAGLSVTEVVDVPAARLSSPRSPKLGNAPDVDTPVVTAFAFAKPKR